MKTWTDPTLAEKPSAVALGNFDGVHGGHQAVLAQVLSSHNPTILTFEPHPREHFSGQTRLLLTPGQERLALFAELGFAQTIVLPFTEAIAQLTAPEFIAKLLVHNLGATQVAVGADFRFGYQRQGDVALLREWGATHGFSVTVAPEVQSADRRVSSSAIREALSKGDCATAHNLLGRAYSLEGMVVSGDQRGRQLGFPTANLALSSRKFIPRNGVYIVKVHLQTTCYWGVMNIGQRPTFKQVGTTVEVHLLDWQGDLYGQVLRVQLLHFLRSEQKFNGMVELQQQIQEDILAAQIYAQREMQNK